MEDIYELIGQKDKALADQLAEFAKNNPDIKLANLSSGMYVSKDKYDTLNNKYTSIQKDLDNANKRQADFDKEKEDFTNKQKAELDKYRLKLRENAINKSLKELGISDPLQLAGVKQALDIDKVSFDEDLNVVGLSEQINDIKEKYKASFDRNDTVQKMTLGSRQDGSSNAKKGITRDEFMNMSEADQLKYVNMLEF